MTTQEFEKLKKTIEDAERELSRNEGMLETHMKSLKDSFGVSSLKEASALLLKMEGELSAELTEITILFDKIETIIKENQ